MQNMQTCKQHAKATQQMQQMQQMRKTWAQKGVGGGRRPPPPLFGGRPKAAPKFCAFVASVAFVALLLHVVCMFACFAFDLHFIYILFASLLAMMRQLLRQWLLPRMLWMLYYTIWYHIIQYGIILYNMVSYCTILYHIVQYDII